MFREFFRRLFSRRPRNHNAARVDDQPDLRGAHRGSPTLSETRSTGSTADNEASRKYLESAQELRQTVPPTFRWLDQRDMCVEEGTVAGGRHANVLKGRLDGRDVAVKAYRHYMHCFDHDQVRMRCQKETHAHNLLSHRNIVPLVGVYSTQEHPLSLVFDILAEHQDLIAYLRDKPYATKVQLLAEIARGLHHMHAMGVVHGNLERANIVVESDCTPRITGLGSAFVQSPQVNWPEVPPELTRCSAPELVNPGRFGLPRAQITKQSDVYSFGVLAYEVLAGDCVFPHLRADIAAIYAMSSGTRPPRPHDPELSNRFWDMINKCWANEPSERIPIAEVVSALEIELEEARAKLSP